MPGDTLNFGGLDDGPLGDTDLDLVAGTGAVNSNGGICVIDTVIQWIPTFA